MFTRVIINQPPLFLALTHALTSDPGLLPLGTSLGSPYRSPLMYHSSVQTSLSQLPIHILYAHGQYCHMCAPVTCHCLTLTICEYETPWTSRDSVGRVGYFERNNSFPLRYISNCESAIVPIRGLERPFLTPLSWVTTSVRLLSKWIFCLVCRGYLSSWGTWYCGHQGSIANRDVQSEGKQLSWLERC